MRPPAIVRGVAKRPGRLAYPEPMERLLAIFAAVLLVTATAGTGRALAAGAPAASTSASGPAAAAGPAFADVPPCHWAAKAVAKVARTGIFVGFPPDPGYDSVNALRQVFEGLQCGQPSWSVRFMTGVPGAFRAAGGPSLASFTLRPRVVSLDANEARLAFQLNVVIDQNGTRRTVSRQGTATARHTGAGWQVAYADLAGLHLPFFPR